MRNQERFNVARKDDGPERFPTDNETVDEVNDADSELDEDDDEDDDDTLDEENGDDRDSLVK